MDKLLAELQRLYFLPKQTGEYRIGSAATLGHITPELARQTLTAAGSLRLDAQNPDGEQRLLCIALTRPGDWPHAANLLAGIEADLDLPAPAVSIDGQGHRLWFSLAQAVPAAQAQIFLDGLRRRYLAEIPPTRLQTGSENRVPLPPAPLADGERWTAFIDPNMGSMFLDEAWLEMPPGLNRQAELLAGFNSIPPADFTRALAMLSGPENPATAEAPPMPAPVAVNPPEMLKTSGRFADPKSFLLAVMNDAGVSLQQRIEAAKALLPYFPDDHQAGGTSVTKTNN